MFLLCAAGKWLLCAPNFVSLFISPHLLLFFPIYSYFLPPIYFYCSHMHLLFTSPTCIYSLFLPFSLSPHLLLFLPLYSYMYVCIYIYICPHIYSYFPPFTRISLLFLFSFCLLCMVLQPTRRTLLSINFPPRPDCSITSELASKVALFVCFRCAEKAAFQDICMCVCMCVFCLTVFLCFTAFNWLITSLWLCLVNIFLQYVAFFVGICGRAPQLCVQALQLLLQLDKNLVILE